MGDRIYFSKEKGQKKDPNDIGCWSLIGQEYDFHKKKWRILK